jgi:hypothetical protein
LRCYILKTIAMFAFMRFYLRVLADLNEIIRRRKRFDILTTAIHKYSLRTHPVHRDADGISSLVLEKQIAVCDSIN